ncbi:DUF4352 domain-containing protein [Methanomassiliicoccus luminyensis]|uniref:hypothetical protein n=1 Tax=Methanomassiliicoccus luminyensis TaxID=1080712 RepID=UPI0003772004|nr:hypothetical protein [Methanomassiliicoccus luminyensis]
MSASREDRAWRAVLVVALVVIAILSAAIWQDIAQANEPIDGDNKKYSPQTLPAGSNSNSASKVEVHELRGIEAGDTFPVDLTGYNVPEGTKLLALNVTLTNNLRVDDTVYSFLLITDDGGRHYRTILEPDNVPATIGSNRTSATFWLVYEVDEDATAAQLEYAKPSFEILVPL